MTVDAEDRRQLREQLEATLGEHPADVLMEQLFVDGDGDGGGGVAVLRSDIADLAARMDRRFDLLERRMDGLENRMDGLEHRMDGLDQHMDRIRERMDWSETRLGRLETGQVTADDRIHAVWRAMVTGFLMTAFSSWGLVLAGMAIG